MGGRKPDKFVLKPKDAAFLRELLRNGRTPLRVARRAWILLGRADAEQRIASLVEKVEQDRTTIWRVCARYQEGGLDAALYDAPRSGRPRVFPSRKRRKVEWLARQAPASVGRKETRWSQRSLAHAAGPYVGSIHQATVGHILREAHLQLHRFRYWKSVVWNEEAVARATRILWYYERADSLWQRGEVILCVDEKPNLQVLERSKPTQPMRPDRIERQEFEYIRHGTVNLLAASVVHNGRMWAECVDKNDGEYFRAAVRRLLHPYNWAKRIHLIMDEAPSHTSGDTSAFFHDLSVNRRASMCCSRLSTAPGSIKPNPCWKPSASGTCCAEAGAVAP